MRNPLACNAFRLLLVAAGLVGSGACRDAIRLTPPPDLDDRLIVFAALDPDSAWHPLVVEPAEAGRLLTQASARLYRANAGSPDAAWELVDATFELHDDDVCRSRYPFAGLALCLRFEAVLEPGSTYRVEVSSEGRATAVGQTGVVGPFTVESAALSGGEESATLTAAWTPSVLAERYVVSVRRFNVRHIGGERGWFTDSGATSITTGVPGSAIRNALEPLTLDVVAFDANLWAYLTTGSGGDGFSIPPVQNVEGGFGVIGSFTFRSTPLASDGVQ